MKKFFGIALAMTLAGMISACGDDGESVGPGNGGNPGDGSTPGDGSNPGNGGGDGQEPVENCEDRGDCGAESGECPAGQYFTNEACAPCPEGSFCVGGAAQPQTYKTCTEGTAYQFNPGLEDAACCETVTFASTATDPTWDDLEGSDDSCLVIVGNMKVTTGYAKPMVDRLYVEGMVIVEGITHTDMSILSNLRRAQELSVAVAPNLINFLGLDSLEQLGNLVAANNPELRSLKGLEAITELYTLGVYQNPELRSLEGLESLTTIERHLNLSNLPKLESIDALSSLTHVGRMFDMIKLPLLTSLEAFANLEHVGEKMQLRENGFCNQEGVDLAVRMGKTISVETLPFANLADVRYNQDCAE